MATGKVPFTAYDVIIEARKLIAKKANWTKHAYARDANDKGVSSDSDSAYKFCADGAIRRAVYNLSNKKGYKGYVNAKFLQVYKYFECGGYPARLHNMNDDAASHKEVLNAFTAAAKRAKEALADKRAKEALADKRAKEASKAKKK